MSGLADVASTEEVALFNPAFLVALLHGALTDYEKATERGMAPHLPFLLLPLALHRPTRADLPVLASAQMHKWIRENPRHLVGLDARVVGLRPFVGMAVRFGATHGVIDVRRADLRAGILNRRPIGFAAAETEDVKGCSSAARFLGRWFARQPDSATLLALWGLRP